MLGLVRDQGVLEDSDLAPASLTKFLTPESEDIWTSRRKIVRALTASTINAEKKAEEKRKEKGEDLNLSKEEIQSRRNKATIAITAGLVAVGGVILRLGGRGALISILGLDFAKDSAISEQLTGLINNIGPDGPFGYASYLGFVALWLGAKVFCVDALTIVLALSSGIIFHGVVQGTVASVACGTLGSSACFLLSRTSLREKTRRIIAKKPSLRAIDRSVTKDGTGFKTVFTLRLSPLLPIPIAAYSYVFGATSIGWPDFVLGTALGSIKPYALDSYLGLVVMGTIQGTEMGDGGAGDVVLLAVLGVVLLVGSLATQVATQAWEETQAELTAEDEAAAKIVAQEMGSGKEQLETRQSAEDGAEDEEDLDFIDLVPLPEPVIKGVKGTYRWVVDERIGSVWRRLEDVMMDEVGVVSKEVSLGVEVPGIPSSSSSSSSSPSAPAQITAYPYPGTRQIRHYELTPLDGASFVQYTVESVMFTFVLLKLLGNGSLSANDDDVQ